MHKVGHGCLFVRQVFQKVLVYLPEVSLLSCLLLTTPSHTYLLPKTTTLPYFYFSSFCLWQFSCTTPKPHPVLFFFFSSVSSFSVYCCCCCCFWFVFISNAVCAGAGCVLVVLCACVCVCVFSPAASVDYGSFADRCSTWLELLRLKAHTIRRGSVKTSRRTQSLAHSGDHTRKHRTRSHKAIAHMHLHTPLCMLFEGGGGGVVEHC